MTIERFIRKGREKFPNESPLESVATAMGLDARSCGGIAASSFTHPLLSPADDGDVDVDE